MVKLNLETTKKIIGVGSFVEKTIKFRDVDEKKFEGEVLIKVLSADELENITNVLSLPEGHTPTNHQFRDALIFNSVYETKEKKFFNEIADLGLVNNEIKNAMFVVSDEVINFSGKHWISMMSMNSTVNSSSTESAVKPSRKQKRT